MKVRAALFPIALLSLAVSSLTVAACGGNSELEDVKAERDALAAELAAVESRSEMCASQSGNDRRDHC